MNEGITAWVLACIAAVTVGLSKTGIPGIGILAAALMVSVFPSKLSVGALLPMLIAGDIFAIAYYRRHAEWKRVLELLPAVAIGMIAGAFVLKGLDSKHLKPFLGALILFLLLLEFARRRMRWASVPDKAWFVVAMGVLAGFATTVGNVAGPIMNIYLMSKGLSKERFMGTIAWYYFIINCSKVPIFLHLGMIDVETLRFDLIMLPGIAAGAIAGRFILGGMKAETFKFLVFALAAVAAVRLLLW
jgi:uncharacterized protein